MIPFNRVLIALLTGRAHLSGLTWQHMDDLVGDNFDRGRSRRPQLIAVQNPVVVLPPSDELLCRFLAEVVLIGVEPLQPLHMENRRAAR